MLTLAQTLEHYFNVPQVLMMFLVAIAAIGISLVCIIVASKIVVKNDRVLYPKVQETGREDGLRKKTGSGSNKTVSIEGDVPPKYMKIEILNLMERLYELIFSATMMLLFVSIYFNFEYFGASAPVQAVWDKFSAFILLILILISVMFNSLLDKHLAPLTYLRPGDRGTMRLIGMVYMLIIFAYIKFIYVDDNYDSIIIYFITLVIGRFIYFDASMGEFKSLMKNVRNSLPLLALALMCSGLIAYVGFSSKYLLHPNGTVWNLFIGHIYLLIVIFLINRTKVLENLLSWIGKQKEK